MCSVEKAAFEGDLRVSRFLHIVDGVGASDGYCVLYNALTLGTVIVSRDVADRIRFLRESGTTTTAAFFDDDAAFRMIEELTRHRMFLHSSQSEYEYHAAAWHPIVRPRIGVLYLLLTDRCIMKCSYCYMLKGIPLGYDYSMMTQEIAQYGIDLFTRSLAESQGYGVSMPRIGFFGGEPLLNFPILSEAMRVIEEYKSSGRLAANTLVTLNTNGTLVTPEIARFLGQHDVRVIISLDGWQSINDTYRLYRTGTGTFDDVVRGLETLEAAGVQPTVSCTVYDHNVDNIEEVLEWILDNFKVTAVSLNPFVAPAIRDPKKAMEWASKAAEKLISCYQICRSRGIYEGRVMRYVRAFVQGHIQYSDCAGCGQQVVVDPKGNVGVCHAYCGTKEYFVPYGQALNPLDHPYWNEWRLRSPLVLPQCLDCIALSICGGGCPQSAHRLKGSIWEIDEISCIIPKTVTNFILLELLETKLKEVTNKVVRNIN